MYRVLKFVHDLTVNTDINQQTQWDDETKI